jgi:hypothetical protein
MNAVDNEKIKEVATVNAVVGKNKIETNVLLDSGSAADIITESLLRKAGWPKELDICAVKLIQADGQSNLQVIGQTVVEIGFTTGTITVPVVVVTAPKDQLILSNGTLQSYGVKTKEMFLSGVERAVAAVEVADNAEGFDALMETVLIPAPEMPAIPIMEELFPIVKSLKGKEKEMIAIFYKRLSDLLYFGEEPIIGPLFDVQLRENFKPFHCHSRAFPPAARVWMEKNRDIMLAKKWIQEKNEPGLWASDLFPVPKGDGDFRPVVDFTRVNKELIVPGSAMPVPDSDDDRLSDAQCYGKLDLLKGYHQVAISEIAGDVLSIMILDRVYKPLRLFPGVASATAYFQAIMVNTLGTELTEKQKLECQFPCEPLEKDSARLKVWLDDVRMASADVEKQLGLLERTLIKMRDRRVRLNLAKCLFMGEEVVFCGKKYSKEGIVFDPQRTQCLIDTPVPQRSEDLLTFLCSVNWNRSAIPRFATVVEPLVELMESIYQRAGARTKVAVRKIPLQWEEKHTVAFQHLKSVMKAEIVRDFPRESYDLVMFSDASTLHWSACLMHAPPAAEGVEFKDREWRILSFASGSFRSHSLNWDVQSKEGFAVLAALEKFKYLLINVALFILNEW